MSSRWWNLLKYCIKYKSEVLPIEFRAFLFWTHPAVTAPSSGRMNYDSIRRKSGDVIETQRPAREEVNQTSDFNVAASLPVSSQPPSFTSLYVLTQTTILPEPQQNLNHGAAGS